MALRSTPDAPDVEIEIVVDRQGKIGKRIIITLVSFAFRRHGATLLFRIMLDRQFIISGLFGSRTVATRIYSPACIKAG